MTHKRYLVTGRRQYRWHKPGAVFEAVLDPDAEQRAIERGSIRVLEIIEPELKDGTYELPKDWSPPVTDVQPPRDASLASTTKEGR